MTADSMLIESKQVTPEEPKVDEETLVIESLFEQLGRPGNLNRVNAEKLWNNHYRVNVFCTVDSDRPMKSIELTDSFFIKLTDEGIESNPPIKRKY